MQKNKSTLYAYALCMPSNVKGENAMPANLSGGQKNVNLLSSEGSFLDSDSDFGVLLLSLIKSLSLGGQEARDSSSSDTSRDSFAISSVVLSLLPCENLSLDSRYTRVGLGLLCRFLNLLGKAFSFLYQAPAEAWML